MRRINAKAILGFQVGLGALFSLFGATGCTESGAGKAWSSLSQCAVGKSADAAPAERMKQLRLIQLSNPATDGKPDSWPGRCAVYANQLYVALDGSGKDAALKRGMQSKLGCSQDKPSCVVNHDTVLTLIGDLSDSAKSAELKFEPVPSVKEPEITAKPVLSAADWVPLRKEPAQLVGPDMTAEGKVHWLLKNATARERPTGCTFTPASKEVTCSPSHEKVVAFPPQSVQLVHDQQELIAAGMTEQGLAAFNLKTGESVVVKGMPGNIVRDGLALERGEGDKGFFVVNLAKGKANKPVELKSKGTITQPLTIGNQVVWLEPAEGSSTFVAKTLKNNRLVESVSLSGAFSGPFHICQSASLSAVASWAPRSGQRSAKPTAGSDMTQVTVTMLSGGAWSKPAEAKIPFRRGIESELVCTGSTASMAWAEPVDGGVKIGQLTCDKNVCKVAETSLPDVESRWWWAVGAIGDKLLVMWRASFGETRMRLAPLGQLAQTKDVVLFDDQEHGGPKAGEVTSLFLADSALLLFKQEPPVALSIASDGTAKVLTAK